MIIRRLHINSFGKFKDYVIDFEPGFNVVYGQNEDGKSTLMGFIMMMFYGNSYSGKDISQNLRKRFRPWDGSPMRGKMLFEVDRIQYQLTRTFHASNSTDNIQLRHAVTDDILKLGKTPGETLLDLKQSEFEKSVFVSQGGSIIGKTNNEGINERLTNMASSGDEDVSPDKIQTRLERASIDLISKRGDKGRLIRTRKRLSQLHEALEQAEKDEKEKSDQQDNLTKLAQLRQQKLEALEAIQDGKLTCQNRIHLGEVTRAIERENERLELHRILDQEESQLMTKDGLIDSAYIDEAESIVQDIRNHLRDKSDSEHQIASLKVEEKDLKSEDREPLSQEKLEVIKEKASRLQTLQTTLDRQQGDFSILQEFFDAQDMLNAVEQKGKSISQEQVFFEAQLQEIKKRVDKKRESHAELLQEESQIANLITSLERDKQKQLERIEQLVNIQGRKARGIKKRKPKLAIFIALIIISSLACSIMYYAFGSIAWVGLLVPLALAAYLVIHYIASSYQPKTRENHYLELQSKEDAYLASIIEDLEKNEAFLTDVIQKKEKSEGVLKSIEESEVEPKQKLVALNQAAIKNDVNSNMHLQRLGEIKNRLEDQGLEASQDKLDQLTETIQGIAANIEMLRDQLYEETQPFGSADLEDLIDRYHADKHHQENKDRIKRTLDQKLAVHGEIESNLEDLFAKLQTQLARVEQVTTLDDSIISIDQLKKQIDRVKTLRIQAENADKHRQRLESEFNLEALEAKRRKLVHALSGKEEAKNIDRDLDESLKIFCFQEEEMKKELACLDQEIISLKAELKEKYRDKLNVSQLNDQIKHLENVEERLGRNHQALDIAMTTINESFRELQQDFGPRLNRLTAKNLSMLTHQKYNQVKVAKDLGIAVGRGDQDQVFSWQHLSEGTIDQAYLALRMAIIELVISKEKALPLLLDDIFAQYDDERAAWGLAFLKEKRRVDYPVQIILFTCHERIIREAKELGGIKILTL